MNEEANDKSPDLCALVDVTSLDSIAFVKKVSIDKVPLWVKILGMDGKLIRKLDSIKDLEQLQYLYWNTTQQAPSDNIKELRELLVQSANNLTEDETPSDELMKAIPEEFRESVTKSIEENSIMGQGSATEGTLEKGAAKKGGKKTAAAAKETTKAKEEKPKRVKDPTGRPSEGTQTRKVWDIADKLAAKNDDVTPTRAEVVAASEKAGVNKATAGVQYGAWFKGMKRKPAPKPVKEEKAETAAEGEAGGEEGGEEEGGEE